MGYGPAGEEVSRALREEGIQVAVLDLNPSLVTKALHGCLLDGLADSCMVAQLGDATHPDALSHLKVGDSRAVVVTLPDHRATREVVRQVRSLAPETLILARGRLSRYIHDLAAAGANVTIDEEAQMGMELGRQAKARLL
ncbi:MAG: NAD-binding protein [Deltaproteobacteria bacterium]